MKVILPVDLADIAESRMDNVLRVLAVCLVDLSVLFRHMSPETIRVCFIAVQMGKPYMEVCR